MRTRLRPLLALGMTVVQGSLAVWAGPTVNVTASEISNESINSPAASIPDNLTGMISPIDLGRLDVDQLGRNISQPIAILSQKILPLPPLNITSPKILELPPNATGSSIGRQPVAVNNRRIQRHSALPPSAQRLEDNLNNVADEQKRSISDEQASELAAGMLAPGARRGDQGFLADYLPAIYSKLSPATNARFIFPNEASPQDARRILQFNNGELYVSVGTERAFNGAALAKGISHLLTLDKDPGAILYNRINAALLQLARHDRKEYRRLRFNSTAAEWQRLSLERNISPENQEILNDPDNWKFWSAIQAYYLSEGIDLRSRNYIEDDALFNKLSQMADLQQIRGIQMDLRNTAEIESLVGAVKNSKIKLGVLDLSNAWWDQYMTTSDVTRLLDRLAHLATFDTILMITDRIGWSMYASFGTPYLWAYFGFHFGEIFSHPQGIRVATEKILSRVSKYRHNRLNRIAPPASSAAKILNLIRKPFRINAPSAQPS